MNIRINYIALVNGKEVEMNMLYYVDLEDAVSCKLDNEGIVADSISIIDAYEEY